MWRLNKWISKLEYRLFPASSILLICIERFVRNSYASYFIDNAYGNIKWIKSIFFLLKFNLNAEGRTKKIKILNLDRNMHFSSFDK